MLTSILSLGGRAVERRKLRGWRSLLQVLESPNSAFEYLSERPAWIPPYLVSTILGGLGSAVSLPVTLGIMETELAQQGLQSASLTNWVLVGGVVGAILGPLLAGAFVSGLVFGLLWAGGQGVTFKSIFSVVGYARLPLGIGALINSFMVSTAASSADIRQISLSAAALVPSGSSPFVIGFLSTLAPFDMWYLVLVTLGVASVSRRSVSQVWWVSAVLYGLNLLLVMLGSGLSPSSLQ